MGLEKSILDLNARFKKENKEILKLIKQFDRIAVFRHIKPDFDALGTQYGLATWLKDNFPKKEIICLGDNHVVLTPRLFPESERVNESWFEKPFLAFIVDVGDAKRVADPRFEKASKIIKIDHHPKTQDIADVDITMVEAAAASEVVAGLLLNYGKKYKLSKTAAEYFHIALVGDTGRFQFSSVGPLTFAVACHFVDAGVDAGNISKRMFVKQIEDLELQAYVLTHYTISPKGVAYYILPQDIQDRFHITSERGKENVNIFSNVEGVGIWCSITEDPTPNEYCWRVSIRSKEVPINEVATKWEGGGHDQASGAKLLSLDDLPEFIKDLEELL